MTQTPYRPSTYLVGLLCRARSARTDHMHDDIGLRVEELLATMDRGAPKVLVAHNNRFEKHVEIEMVSMLGLDDHETPKVQTALMQLCSELYAFALRQPRYDWGNVITHENDIWIVRIH